MSEWQLIDTAPKDKMIIGGDFEGRYATGDVMKCWWQPEFDAFITGAREMVCAEGYTFEDGSTRQLHSPEFARASHWIPYTTP